MERGLLLYIENEGDSYLLSFQTDKDKAVLYIENERECLFLSKWNKRELSI